MGGGGGVKNGISVQKQAGKSKHGAGRIQKAKTGQRSKPTNKQTTTTREEAKNKAAADGK